MVAKRKENTDNEQKSLFLIQGHPFILQSHPQQQQQVPSSVPTYVSSTTISAAVVLLLQ